MSKLILAALLCVLVISCMGVARDAPQKDLGFRTVYRASYYSEYSDEDSACFGDMMPVKDDTGLMADLEDICIVRENGIVYLEFQAAGSESIKVLIMGEDSLSYTVVYVTNTEEFIVSKVTYDGNRVKHTNSHVILSMYLANVFRLCEDLGIHPYIIQAKWVIVEDETYMLTTYVEMMDMQCFTPEQGRLAGLEICLNYYDKTSAELLVNGVVVRINYDYYGSYVNIVYTTVDDCIRIYSRNWLLVDQIISTELLFIDGEGVVGDMESGDVLTVSIDYDEDGDTLQYDCMNLYNPTTIDYVLYSSINIICVYCRQDIEPGAEAHCGIGTFSKEKETSIFQSFNQIDKTLSFTYQTGTETITIDFGDEDITMYADELYYYLETIQEHELHPLMGELDSDYLTGSLSTADCNVNDGVAIDIEVADDHISFACNMGGCFVGQTQGGVFNAGKYYHGSFESISVFTFNDDEFSEAYEFCLSFYSINGDVMNHCLMKEQLEMYRHILTMYPIFTM